MHRTRPSHGRSHRKADGREEDLAEYTAVSVGDGGGVSTGIIAAGQVRRSVEGDGYHLSSRKKIFAQNRLRHRHLVFPRAGTASGGTSGEPNTLVHARGNPHDGN